VTAYIIETGIRSTHTEFGGRAVAGYDAVTPGGRASDCNGHGTHVAVRVLNCNGSGTTVVVIAGIDWVTGNHRAGLPAVANMSLGGSASSALDCRRCLVRARGRQRLPRAFRPERLQQHLSGPRDRGDDGERDRLVRPETVLGERREPRPQTTGVAALYLQSTPGASPSQVQEALRANTTAGVVVSPGSGSPNKLLFTNY
jgi:subtilisin family serine protease